MVKIKVSYEDESELLDVIMLLGEKIMKYKISSTPKGRYRTATIYLNSNIPVQV